MFERYTTQAIKCIMHAQEESRRLGHNYISNAQLLFGVLAESTGIAATTLKEHGLTIKNLRSDIEKLQGKGSGFVATEIPFTPAAKETIQLTWQESQLLGTSHIGTEHLLLAIIRNFELHEQDGDRELLTGNGIFLTLLRDNILARMLNQHRERYVQRYTPVVSKSVMDELYRQIGYHLKDGDTAQAIIAVQAQIWLLRFSTEELTKRSKELAQILEVLSSQVKELDDEATTLTAKLAELPSTERQLSEEHALICTRYTELSSARITSSIADDALDAIENELDKSRAGLLMALKEPLTIHDRIGTISTKLQTLKQDVEFLKAESLNIPKELTQLAEIEAQLNQKLSELKDTKAGEP